jgi:hypothetical protein
MPFSRYYIEPEHIEVMRAAFHDALLLNGDVDDPMTEVVVNKIVALVRRWNGSRRARHRIKAGRTGELRLLTRIPPLVCNMRRDVFAQA